MNSFIAGKYKKRKGVPVFGAPFPEGEILLIKAL
jgi:hypothetical protein